MAAEHGIDLSTVAGTGAGGRISKQDIEAAIAGAPVAAASAYSAPASAASSVNQLPTQADDEVTLSTAVSIAVVACALLISQAPAILSTRSALFIVSPRRSLSCPAQTGRQSGEG